MEGQGAGGGDRHFSIPEFANFVSVYRAGLAVLGVWCSLKPRPWALAGLSLPISGSSPKRRVLKGLKSRLGEFRIRGRIRLYSRLEFCFHLVERPRL